MSDEQPKTWRDVASIACFAGTIIFGVGGVVLLVFDAVSIGGFALMAATGLVLCLMGLYFASRSADLR
jgi:hypothetical protein